MSERILKLVGDYIGGYIESCPRNFVGVWKEYMRVRVTADLAKPLKRRMKIRKTGDEWLWINFKYENVPTFCFICGLLGHSERYCGRLFDTPEHEIVKPYGIWMRAPLRRQTKLIGERWLCNDFEKDNRNPVTRGAGSQGHVKIGNQGEKFAPQNQESNKGGEDSAGQFFQNNENGEIFGKPNQVVNMDEGGKSINSDKSVTVLAK